MIRRKRKAPDGDDIADDMCQTTRGDIVSKIDTYENTIMYLRAIAHNL